MFQRIAGSTNSNHSNIPNSRSMLVHNLRNNDSDTTQDLVYNI